MIGRCQVEFHQFKDRLEEALGLPTGQSVNGLDCGHSLNCQVGIGRGGSWFSSQFIGRPIGDRFGTDPNLQASPFFERGVILAPVADAVRGFLFHGRKSLPLHLVRNSSLRFVQQSRLELIERRDYTPPKFKPGTEPLTVITHLEPLTAEEMTEINAETERALKEYDRATLRQTFDDKYYPMYILDSAMYTPDELLPGKVELDDPEIQLVGDKSNPGWLKSV